MALQNCKGAFPEAQPEDMCLTFGACKPGGMPLKQAAVKTEGGFEELDGSMVELGGGILLAVQSTRCCDKSLIFRPLDQRREEVEGYRKHGCNFRRNGDSNSNFYNVAAAENSTLWVRNEGEHALRFQTPDGRIYRVCTGYTEALRPANLQAQTAPAQVLLELGSNPLDLRVGAVHVRYGTGPWLRGGVDCMSGSQVDSCFCRVFCGGDCLGVLESFSDYFLERPRLALLDIKTYGPSQWFVRSQSQEALTLAWPDGRTADVPADGQVYSLETLAACRGEAEA